MALQRLGHMLGETRYLEAAERTLKAFDNVVQRNPAACPSLLMALEEYMEPPALVILRGPSVLMRQWQQELNRQYLPNTISLALPDVLDDIPPALARSSQNVVNAWVCRGVQCLPPVDNLEGLLQNL